MECVWASEKTHIVKAMCIDVYISIGEFFFRFLYVVSHILFKEAIGRTVEYSLYTLLSEHP